MRWTIEPVRAVFPDRQPPERDPREQQPKKDTFDRVLQEAQEQEDGRKDRGGT